MRVKEAAFRDGKTVRAERLRTALGSAFAASSRASAKNTLNASSLTGLHPFYRTAGKNKAEADFPIEAAGGIIPPEVRVERDIRAASGTISEEAASSMP